MRPEAYASPRGSTVAHPMEKIRSMAMLKMFAGAFGQRWSVVEVDEEESGSVEAE